MKIIKNCAVISFLLVIMSGCGAKVTHSSGATSNPFSSNSGSGGPVVPPPVTNWRTKTVDEVKNFKDADGKNLFQLNIGKPQELKELIQKVGDAKAIEMAIEGDKPYKDGDDTIVITKSPLRMAIENDDDESLNALLAIPGIEAELAKNINNNEPYGTAVSGFITGIDPTLLHIAAENGKVKAFTALIKKDPNLLKKVDSTTQNPLMSALAKGRNNILESFLNSSLYSDDQKKEILLKENEKGSNSLFLSVFYKQEEAFKQIIEKFPEFINLKFKGENLAHIAIEKNCPLVIEELAEKSPNIFNEESEEGFLPLFNADNKDIAVKILSKTSKEAIQKCGTKLSLIHQTVFNQKKSLLEALVSDTSGKVDLGLTCNNQKPIEYIFNKANDTIEPFILALNAEQINAKNSEGLTALHLAVALESSKIALLVKNPNLDVNISNNNGHSAIDIAINNAPSYQHELKLTAEQKTKPSNNIFINFMRLQDNTQNRNKAVDALLQVTNLSEKTITNAAIVAAEKADTINLKKLLNTNKVKLDEEIEASKGIKANKLVWRSLYFIFVDLTEINKVATISDENGGRWDADVYYKTQITKAVIDNLQALKDAGLPKEAFSRGILKMDDGRNINWNGAGHNDAFTGGFTWHFKEVQDKLKELATIDLPIK